MIQKFLTVGGLMTLFVLSLAVPGPLVLTVLQLALITGTAVAVYHHFGDSITTFINQVRGGQDGESQAASAPGAGVPKQRVQEPTVAAANAAAEGERDPA